jgi:alpha-glucosidase
MDIKWWQKGVFYQIFLRSFKDSNDDGIGDLPGLISKIDYLSDLGVDAITITPFFPSPYYDSGFDVSDYFAVDNKLGTIADLVQLIDKLHTNNIKIVIEIPINHTSIEHAWFKESALSKDNEFSDFYIWSDQIPNNWISNFEGKAWTYHPTRKQYYMHSLSKKIPDLNWRCEALVCKMLEVFKYYLELGVDGLSLGCINLIIKDRDLRDNPKYPGTFFNNYLKQRHIFDRNRPYLHKVIRRVRSLVDSYEDKVLIGDVVVAPPGEPELVASLYGMYKDELNLAYDYSIANTTIIPKTFRAASKRWIEACDTSWPSLVLSSHDHKRLLTKFGGNIEKTRLATMFLMTQRGTPFIYYGEELGLENAFVSKREQKDLQRKQWFFFQNSRDGSRSPMLWDNSAYAGFSNVKPYLPQDNIKKCVINQQEKDVSMYKYCKKFIALRKKHEALVEGDMSFVDINDENIIAYIRTTNRETLLVLLNFSRKKRIINLNDIELPFITKTSIFSTNPLAKCPDYNKKGIFLQGYEGAIYSIDI